MLFKSIQSLSHIEQGNPQGSIKLRVRVFILIMENFMHQTLTVSALLMALGVGSSCLAQAQPYPNKPIRVLVGYAPGGSEIGRAHV